MLRRISRFLLVLWAVPALVWAGISPGASFFRCRHDGQVRATCCCTGNLANGAARSTPDGCCCTIETYRLSELAPQSNVGKVAKPIAPAVPVLVAIAEPSPVPETRVRPIEIHDRGRPSILLLDRSFRI